MLKNFVCGHAVTSLDELEDKLSSFIGRSFQFVKRVCDVLGLY